MRRLFHTRRALALAAAAVTLGCGMRTSIQADADAVDDDPFGTGGAARACGHGPPCNRSDIGGRTCESLGLPSGVLACDPATCNLDISGCGSAPVDGGAQPPVGSGNPGSPGLFGSAGTGAGTFGAGQSGFFGSGFGDAGFFGGNFSDGGFFGGGNQSDEDGGTDEPGGNGGFFGSGSGFFGGQ